MAQSLDSWIINPIVGQRVISPGLKQNDNLQTVLHNMVSCPHDRIRVICPSSYSIILLSFERENIPKMREKFNSSPPYGREKPNKREEAQQANAANITVLVSAPSARALSQTHRSLCIGLIGFDVSGTRQCSQIGSFLIP